MISISIISATYSCSDDSLIDEDSDEINEFATNSINNLRIGLIKSEYVNVFNRITADLILDAQKITLSNASEETIELISGDYEIKFIESTSEGVELEVDGSSEKIEEEELGGIGGLEIYIIDTQTDYPYETNLILGTKEISLSNDENPSELITINQTQYVIELYSASDNDATIKVKKCETGEIIEVETETQENTTDDIIILNDDQDLDEDLNKTDLNQTQEPDLEEKLNFFQKIIQWFKNLFK